MAGENRSSWADVLRQDTRIASTCDTDTREEKEHDASSEPQCQSIPVGERRRGRPKGTTGSQSLRNSLKFHKEQREKEAAEKLTPIERARKAKEEQRASQQEALAKMFQGCASSSRPAPKGNQRSVVEGFGQLQLVSELGSMVQRKLGVAWSHSTSASEGDEDAVVDELLQETGLGTSSQSLGHLLSKQQDGSKKGKNHSRTVQRLLWQTGAAVYEMGTWFWGLMMSNVVAKFNLSSNDDAVTDDTWEPIAHLTCLRYDETPHRIRVVSSSSGLLVLPSRDAENAKASGWLQQTDLEQSLKELAQSATHGKIMQMEHFTGCLCKHRRTNKYCFLFGEVPTSLAAVDRTTAENTRAILWNNIRKIPEVQRLWQPYPLKLRISVADRAPANPRTEIGLNEPEFMPDHTKCALPCDVHKVATCMKYVTHLAEDDVSGVLNTGLVCSDLGATRALRGILILIFANELQIDCSPAPLGRAQIFRKEAYNLFLPTEGVPLGMRKLNLKRRYILEHFLNSDLEEKAIRHHCQFGCCASEAETREAFSFFVSWALIPTTCPIYSRKSWTGWEKAVSWCGVLATHHSLLERVLLHLLGHPDPGPAVPSDPARGARAGWKAAMIEDIQSSLPKQGGHGKEQEQLQPLQGDDDADGQGVQEASQPAGTEIHDWQEFKRQKKKLVRVWAQSNPGPRLAVLKASLDPITRFLSRMLSVGGTAWERRQQHQAMKGEQRSYIVLEAACGSSLRLCVDALWHMFWQDLLAIPFRDVTSKLRCLRFRLVASAMTSLHVLLRVPHSGMPYQLFRILEDVVTGAQRIAQWPVCLLDEFAEAICKRYAGEEALRSAECLCLLEALASIMSLDIASLERKHAKNCDHTLLASRGWVPSLETIGSKFSCRFSNFAVSQQASKKATPQADAKRKKGGKSGGGAWRAFLSKTCRSEGVSVHTADMTEMARRFRSLSDAELLQYQLAGEAGTLAHQHGWAAFGPRERKRAKLALPPLPGGYVGDALVSLDSETQICLSGGVPFVDKYDTFKQTILPQKLAQGLVTTLSKTEECELTSSAWAGPPQIVMGMFGNVPDTTKFFEKRSTTSQDASLRWHPPVSTAVKA